MRVTRPSFEGARSARRPRGIAVAREDQPLFEALRALRLRLAAEAKLPPYIVCTGRDAGRACRKAADDAKARCTTFPASANSKIARYGVAFLDVIGQFKKHPALNNRLSATVNATLAAHLRGLDAEAIAAERNLEISTVYGHLAEAIEAGLITAEDALKLDAAERDEIEEAFERCQTRETGKLGPAFLRLAGNTITAS